MLDIKQLEDSIKDATQRAKVDKEYVNYNELGHLFEYNINYEQFLEDISYVIKAYNEDKK